MELFAAGLFLGLAVGYVTGAVTAFRYMTEAIIAKFDELQKNFEYVIKAEESNGQGND